MKIKCPGCSSVLVAKPKHFGRVLNCPKCQGKLHVPNPDKAASSPTKSPQPIQRQATTKPVAAPSNDSQAEAGKPKLVIALATAILASIIGLVIVLKFSGGGADASEEKVAETPEKVESNENTPATKSSGTNDAELEDTNEERELVPMDKLAEILPATFVDPFGQIEEELPGFMPRGLDLNPNEEHGYQFSINATLPNGNTPAWQGSLLLRGGAPASGQKVKRQLFDQKSVNHYLPSLEYGTGVLMPDRRIVVPLELIEGAETIRVVIGDKTWDAEVQKNVESVKLSTLRIKDANFKAPKVEPTFAMQPGTRGYHLIWITPTGQIQVQPNINIESPKKGYFQLSDRFKTQCLGGVVVNNSDRIAGMVWRTNPKARKGNASVQIKPMCRVADCWTDKNYRARIFDQKSAPGTGSIDAIKNTISHSLAQIIVTRDSSRMPVEFHTNLSAKQGDGQVKFGMLRMPRSFEQHLTNSVYLQADSPVELFSSPQVPRHLGRPSGPQGSIPKTLPFLLGEPVMLPLIKFDLDNNSWEESQFSAVVPGGWIRFPTKKLMRATAPPEAQLIRTDKFLVQSREQNIVTILNSIEIESGQVPNGFMPPGFPDFLPLSLKGQQTIKFDTGLGMVQSLDFQGTFKSGAMDDASTGVPVSMSVSRMSDQQLRQSSRPWSE